MCGIAGYFGPQNLTDKKIGQCLELMKRRGPDHAGFKSWKLPNGPNLYFLHSRLSIIDLDQRSNQPFADENHALIFNGEIYNYREVRRQLESEGARFVTESDTEVLFHALKKWGVASLDRLEGMWAFAFFDKAKGTVLLSRDRFGEKPLYFFRDPKGGLFFGSEIKFIAEMADRRFNVNIDALKRYLVNGYRAIYKHAPGFFTEIEELPFAGCLSIAANGRTEQSRYWTPRFLEDKTIDEKKAVQGVRERLVRAVELRLRADVPLAFCMSGGIDSNALISIAKNQFNYDVHGFTVVTGDARYDETDLVQESVKELGIRHTSIPLKTEGFLDDMRTLIHQHDAPVYTISYFAHWVLMKSVAAQGYRISISGTGADELFTGYYDHYLAFFYGLKHYPDQLKAEIKAWETHVKPVIRNQFLGDSQLFVSNPEFRDHLYLEADRFGEFIDPYWTQPFIETDFGDDLLRKRMLNEMFVEAVPVILHEDDLNAMYFSIENRSPFLDRSLFEFAYGVPSRFLIKDGYAKNILRQAMQGIVPEKILNNRKKVGFNAPILSLLDINDKNILAYLFDESPIFEWVKKEKVKELIGAKQMTNAESKFLFNFLNCKMFLEAFAS